MRALLILIAVFFAAPAHAQKDCDVMNGVSVRHGDNHVFYNKFRVPSGQTCFDHVNVITCQDGRFANLADDGPRYLSCTSEDAAPDATLSGPSWSRIFTDIRTLLATTIAERDGPYLKYVFGPGYDAETLIGLLACLFILAALIVAWGRQSPQPAPAPRQTAQNAPPQRVEEHPVPEPPKPPEKPHEPVQTPSAPAQFRRKRGPMLPSDRWK